MQRLAFAVLVVLAGCVGPPAADSSSSVDSAGPPTTATPTATPPANETAGERAITAEKERVRAAVTDWQSVTRVDFGIFHSPTASVVERTRSHVLVAVSVGYSVEFTCGASLDGGKTKARYRVSNDGVQVVTVERDAERPDSPVCG